MLKDVFERILKRVGYKIIKNSSPVRHFHSDHYLQHNARRLEHLASFSIPVRGLSVLEVGAGIGDHSHYYIDRDCQITITDARQDNLDYLRLRYPEINILQLDLDSPHPLKNTSFDIVHCYGLLYHLQNPELALDFLSQSCKKILFLETCVSFGSDKEINLTKEIQINPTQAFSGVGCRPTRQWIFSYLQKHFEYVYIPKTQPNHKEFPLDWNHPEKHQGLSRSIFIASRTHLDNQILTNELIQHQSRQI